MIRVAIVGAGHWGPNLINNFHTSERSEVAWVVDRDEERLRIVGHRFPNMRTTGNVDDALDDPGRPRPDKVSLRTCQF